MTFSDLRGNTNIRIIYENEARPLSRHISSRPCSLSGVNEIRIRESVGAFRVVYVAKFEKAVYVLHAFHKKTRKTAQADIELAAQRYKLIREKT